MKMINKIIGLLALVALCACNDPFEPSIPLAIDNERVELNAAEGSTHIMVYSTGKWSVTIESNYGDWATLDNATGNGNGDFIVNYSKNSGLARNATLHINSGNKVCDINLYQKSSISEPNMQLLPGSVELLKVGAPITMTLDNNLGEELARVQSEVVYGEDSDEGWITDVVLEGETLNFNVADNNSGALRIATITLFIDDANGERFQTSATLTQNTADFILEMNPTETNHEALNYGETLKVPYKCNIPSVYGKVDLKIDYTTGDKDWLDNYKFNSKTENIEIKIPANPNDERIATFALRFDNGRGKTIITDNKVTVKQANCDIVGIGGDQMDDEDDNNQW